MAAWFCVFLLAVLSGFQFFSGNFSFYAGTPLGHDALFVVLVFLFVSKIKIQVLHLVLAQLVLAGVFIKATHTELLFTDDHPSFFYRLALLKEHFPSIPFYNTDWNAGYSAREFFPSGVLNVFFLSAPFLYMIDLLGDLRWYNFLIAYIYIGLIPLFMFLACRLLRLNNQQAVIAAFLTLAPNYEFFRWLLQYGTLGFLCSVGLLPLTWALAYRLGIDDEEPKWWMVPALLVSSALTLFWSLSFIPLLPLTIAALCGPQRLLARWRYMLVFAACFLLINYSWILTFITESKVFSFVQGDKPGGAHSKGSSGTGWENFIGNFTKFNPLLITAGLFIRKHKLDILLFGSALFCVVIAAWGQVYKPQLELDRMVLPASAFLAIIAGRNIGAWLQQRLPGSVLAGFLVITLLLGGAVYGNKTSVKFKLAERDFPGLVEILNTSDSDGRVFFSGFILHEMEALTYSSQDGGHVAMLPLFVDRQFYASHFYHARWSLVDPIPEEVRKRGEIGIEEFLEKLNVSTLITFSRPWAEYCKKSERYTQIGKVGRFRVFERTRHDPDWTISGDAEVELVPRGIRVKLKSKEAVLKYQYQPRLKANGDVEVVLEDGFTDDHGHEFDFIKLRASEVPQTVELTY